MLRLTEDVLRYVGPEELALVKTMIVEVTDTGYFGHFYLETLQRMPRLRDLVLILTDMRTDPRRGHGQRYIDSPRAEFVPGRDRDEARVDVSSCEAAGARWQRGDGGHYGPKRE